MHNPISITLALITRLARRWTGHPVGNRQGSLSPRGFGLNPHGPLTASFAVLVVAAVPQCGATQTPVPEPDPVSVAEPAEAPSSEPAEVSSSAPEAVVSALMEAMQANDAEQIRSLFAPNASQAYGDGAARSGEAFFSWLDSDIIERQGRVEDAQLSVDGNEVVVTGQYQSRGYTSAANFLITVEDGLITSWRMRY